MPLNWLQSQRDRNLTLPTSPLPPCTRSIQDQLSSTSPPIPPGKKAVARLPRILPSLLPKRTFVNTQVTPTDGPKKYAQALQPSLRSPTSITPFRLLPTPLVLSPPQFAKVGTRDCPLPLRAGRPTPKRPLFSRPSQHSKPLAGSRPPSVAPPRSLR